MSVIIQPSDITDVAPELADQTTQRLEFYIELARSFVNEGMWGAKATKGIILYAAHLATLGAREGAGGAITAERVGDLQRSYGSSSSEEDYELKQTSYGTMFLSLRKTLAFTPILVG
jgi:hypothetical protein